MAEPLVTAEQQLDDDKVKDDDDDDGSENEETNSIEDRQSLPSEVTAEGDSDDVTATTMINGDDLEEGEIVDDDDSKQYSRDFLLSLQFLDQCKQRPPNIQNAEYMKVLVMLICLIVSLNCHWLVHRSK